jgi:gamma-glutamyl hercynylcysteine S-oxide synthase
MDILAPATPRLDRDAMIAWYRRNRARSAGLFNIIEPSAFEERPIPLRHPFIFYEGHLPAFSYLTFNERGLGEAPVDARYEKLFERGIDPGSLDDAQRHGRTDWPSRAEVAQFGLACDERILAALATAKLEDTSVPRLVRGEAVYTILEHEQMHHETLTYIIHQLAASSKVRVAQDHRDGVSPASEFIDIPAGIATLGASHDEIPFGWDNEFGRSAVDVASFAVSKYPVTNGDWLAFVADGGPVPIFWLERDGQWYLRGVFEELPLPRSWPVYVTHRQAEAYAAWAGKRLPSEAEFHRAAFGTPGGHERPFPWGDTTPSSAFGNFDFARFDPEPVDAHPAGASAWDVRDLIGNGWEWTSTPFAAFPGFEEMASYPQYSADFFDGKHYVMKGASPVTARELVRRSFRNWFYDDYPYMYAKFRCVT